MGCVCGCAAWIVKYILFFVNVLFALAGVALVVLGTLAYTQFGNYDVFLHGEFSGVTIAVLVIGCVIFLVAFCGCCGAVVESRCLLITYGCFLLILLLSQVAVGTWGLLTPGASESLIRMKMKFFFDDEYLDQTSYTFDKLQHDLECCGVYGPADFEDVFPDDDGRVPESCCRLEVVNCVSSSAYKIGCYDRLTGFVDSSIDLVGIVTLGVGVTEILGMVFAFCLASYFKNKNSKLRIYRNSRRTSDAY